MIGLLRKLFWSFLGKKYYAYLKGRNTTYLKDAAWVNIGAHTYDNGAFVWRWHNHSRLIIGKYSSIAANVNFICDSGYHTESEVTTFPLFHEILSQQSSVIIRNKTYTVGDIKEKIEPKVAHIEIGNDVWIGLGATILPGVKIGNGVTILAGAIVSTEVPDYAIVGGIPGRVLKLKHDQETIRKLNIIKWWNWPDEKIKAKVNDFYEPMDVFLHKHSQGL